MNAIKTICALMIIVCLSACSSSSIQLNKVDLIGEWRSSNTMVNGQPLSNFYPFEYQPMSILGFRDNERYYLDYSSGTWEVSDSEISLSNGPIYKVLSFEGGVMTVESEIFEGRLFVDLTGIEADEIITVTETFTKQ